MNCRPLLLLGVLLLAQPGMAEDEGAKAQDAAAPTGDERRRRGFSERESKIGLREGTPVFGGPNSTQGEVVETDTRTDPAFRFPAIDAAFQPWNDWKKRQNTEHNFLFSAHYSTLYQGLSDALPDTDDQSSGGVLRATGIWKLFAHEDGDYGSINVMLDHRHKFRDTPPASLAGSAGYAGLTGLFFNDIGFAVINLNWQQSFNGGRTGLIAGRYDPNDYQNILGMVNPWTIFSNLSINLDTSVALPDSSWGVGAGHWVSDNWYVVGGINDANGAGSDNLEFFDGGAEFYKYAHVGWSPSKAMRYFKNVHLLAWHVDERDKAGVPSSHGFAMAGNWTFDDRFMPFFRLGVSKGAAPIYSESFTLGMIYKFLYRSDLVGFAVNHGSLPDETLRDQTTVEAFWRFQFSQNFAITPSLQVLIDPALNPVDDRVYVLGMRLRLTF